MMLAILVKLGLVAIGALSLKQPARATAPPRDDHFDRTIPRAVLEN